jgi:hypothetical protein
MDEVTLILPAQPRRPENPCDITSLDPHVGRSHIVLHFIVGPELDWAFSVIILQSR